MLSGKKVLTVRISGKERKQKVRKLLLDLAHFRNLLIIFARKYKDLYGTYPLDISLLYGILAREYKGSKQKEFKNFLEKISKSEELRLLVSKLKAQKEKVKNAHLIQFTIRQTVRDFKSYLNSLKSFKNNPSKFKERPNPPKPKKLKYLMNFFAEFNLNTVKRKKNDLVIKLKSGKCLKIKLPEDFPCRISSIRLKLFGTDLYADVVYDFPASESKPKGEYRAGIDIGLDELLSVVSDNPEVRSFIVSGKEVKAFNQWFNKEKSKLQSKIDRARNEKRNTKEFEVKLKSLSAFRKRWIDTQFHRISRKVVDLLYETGHKTIYVGKNALESKNGINLGKKNNQNFVSIPFRKLINMIKYKAKELGMEVVEVDESYTSKTSPFADVIKVQKTKNKALCSGRRNGNFFKDKILNKIFHADLVGALNIIRVGAGLPKLRFYKNLKVLFIKLCNPLRLKLKDLIFKVTPESLLGIGSSKERQLSLSGLNPGTVLSGCSATSGT